MENNIKRGSKYVLRCTKSTITNDFKEFDLHEFIGVFEPGQYLSIDPTVLGYTAVDDINEAELFGAAAAREMMDCMFYEFGSPDFYVISDFFSLVEVQRRLVTNIPVPVE
jgi:hypothetical protein